jgi:hypothetical protein
MNNQRTCHHGVCRAKSTAFGTEILRQSEEECSRSLSVSLGFTIAIVLCGASCKHVSCVLLWIRWIAHEKESLAIIWQTLVRRADASRQIYKEYSELC